MKNTLINVFTFTVGAAIGSLVTWKLLKTKYDRIVQEEIDSVKETWDRLNREQNDVYEADETEEFDDEESPSDRAGVMTRYAALTREYKRPSGDETTEEGGGDDPIESAINGPYVILPQDYGDGNYDHDLYCITYYADHVLADDWFSVLDIEETIGLEALDHFGDHAEDIVHVRNERLKADYEVVRDNRRYAELIAEHPLVREHANRRSN